MKLTMSFQAILTGYHHLILILLLLPYASSTYSKYEYGPPAESLAEERTRSIALIFSFIQCFPNTSHNNNDLDLPSKNLLRIHQTFNPEDHLNEYSNLTDIQTLINLVKTLKDNGIPLTLPFTNAPADIAALTKILTVLYHNSGNWPLFYNTSVWLLQRVNTAMLFWALKVVAAEKFTDTVTVPTSVEIFPQLYLPKNYVLPVAGLNERSTPEHPLHYWISDPGLNDFHTHWHMDNPYWWDASIYQVTRHRKGELFLYLHHQIINRFNIELLSIGVEEVSPLQLQPDFIIPQGYVPDIVNINYADFFTRVDNKRIGDYDDGTMLATLRQYQERLNQGIDQGFFLGPNETHVGLSGENGTAILGATMESATVLSANITLYGSFHNFMHRVLAGMMRPQDFPVPGIQAHSETSMRDPVFYRIHTVVDRMYLKYKSTTKPYTKDELDFPGVSIIATEILTRPHGNTDYRWRPSSQQTTWPLPHDEGRRPTILTTYFRTEEYDISNAARPCRAINDEPVPVQVRILDNVPFSYLIVIQSTRPAVAYGMVRIYIWPERNQQGTLLEGDAAHKIAIELDRFRVRVDPGKVLVINRSSLDSSLTRVEPSPGIKTLYKVKTDSPLLTRPEVRRACAFPNNMLIPRGNKEGLPFKLVVYLSDETDAEEIDEVQFPNYPFCGALNGLPFPDRRPMGFPFDRPGTHFNVTSNSDLPPGIGHSEIMKNLKEIKIVIKHAD